MFKIHASRSTLDFQVFEDLSGLCHAVQCALHDKEDGLFFSDFTVLYRKSEDEPWKVQDDIKPFWNWAGNVTHDPQVARAADASDMRWVLIYDGELADCCYTITASI